MVQNDKLTAAELAERWRGEVSHQTLANWRSQKKGPGYMKVGKKVLYPLAEVEKFERENLKLSQ